MELFDEVSLRHFDADDDGQLSSTEIIERDRVMALNDLPIQRFLELPTRDREAAENLWAARVIQANMRRPLIS